MALVGSELANDMKDAVLAQFNMSAKATLLKNRLQAFFAVNLSQSSDPAQSDVYMQGLNEVYAAWIRDDILGDINLWNAIAGMIVWHIQQTARIDPLTVTNTAMGTPPHTHAPALTVSATGKIQ